MKKRTVTHLIAGLGLGGAETMLVELLSHHHDPYISHRVISLGAGSYYEESINKLGIELVVLQFKKKPLSMFLKLRELVRDTDTLCCWMYNANLIGFLASKRITKDKSVKIIWNIRHSSIDRKLNKRRTLVINHLCARLSKSIDVIAYNGDLARKVHESIGYDSRKSIIVENGCNLDKYKPNKEARKEIEAELGLREGSIIILSIAKDDPIKDLPSFISAVGELHKENPDIIAIMCGRGVEPSNERLNCLFNDANLKVWQDVYPLGMRHDVQRLLSSCDLYVLHSAAEAFPNTLIQAMACECLCVTTDVGDAKRILDDKELTSAPKNIKELTLTIQKALTIESTTRAQKKKRNREIVHEKYDIDKVVDKYEELYSM